MCTNSYWIIDLNDELKFVLIFSIKKKTKKIIEEKSQNNFKKIGIKV